MDDHVRPVTDTTYVVPRLEADSASGKCNATSIKRLI